VREGVLAYEVLGEPEQEEDADIEVHTCASEDPARSRHTRVFHHFECLKGIWLDTRRRKRRKKVEDLPNLPK